MFKFVVLTSLVAVTSAQWVGGGVVSPLAYGVTPLGLGLGAPLVSPLAIGTPLTLGDSLLAPSNYRGPLSLAPGQPANILAADGRPLDTLDVNLDKSAHLTAKALAGSEVRLLKKRSIVTAPITAVPVVSSPLIARSPLIINSPLTAAPIATQISSIGLTSAGIVSPLGARIAGPIGTIASPITPLGLASTSIISPAETIVSPISPVRLTSGGLISPVGTRIIGPYGSIASPVSPLVGAW